MNMKIATKLLVVTLAIGFIPVAIIGGITLLESYDALSKQAFSQLKSVREGKKNQIQDFFIKKQKEMQVLLDTVATFRQNAYQKLQTVQNNKILQIEWFFQRRLDDIKVLSTIDSVSQALEQFEGAFEVEGYQVNGLAWQSVEERLGRELKQYQELYDYQDLFLIAQDGDIVYTTAKRSELGQNVLKGTLADSPLNKAFQKGLQKVSLHDFEPYAPANNQYIAFLSAPLFHFGELVGVLVLSLSPDSINTIVQQREGMGSTGETYLVGQLNGQTGYRSDRVIIGKGRNIIGVPKMGEDINQALAGQSGIKIKVSSTGELKLGAYAPLQIPGLKWCIISVIQLEEIITPQLNESEDFFNRVIQQYGYHDLFLIHPEGKIFYTAKQEADYLTNILSGDYAETPLSQLVQEVLQSKTFGLSDYALYAPSQNEPGAFIAQPLLNNDTVELIVALQLTGATLDEIMLQRVGMGETGETYLVGSDQLMRSNSYLAPKTHSVKASFNNPASGAVKTESSRAALAGQTGEHITLNYLGESVLSAYTPLEVGGRKWALIADIHETEAFAPIRQIEWILGILALMVGIMAFILIRRFTKHLMAPLLQINAHLKILAQGRPIEEDIQYTARDEIGEIVTSTRQLRESIINTIEQANAIAAGNYSNEIKLLSQQDQLRQALFDMTQTLREVTQENTKQDWLKTGQNQLNEQMSGQQNLTDLGHNIISFLTLYVEAQVGLFYWVEPSVNLEPKGRLKLVASYAYTRRKNLADEFQFSEGLVERAATEQRNIVFTINAGLGEEFPHHILLLPFLYETMVKGVIVLGSEHMLTEIQLDFLIQVMPSIGIAVNVIESHSQMQTLLQQTQTQAEELNTQKEQLVFQTQELQHQKEELQNQAEELQSKARELQQTNEELEERRRELQRQKEETNLKNKELEESRAACQAQAEQQGQASQYKSEFLASMSHELRTPLNSLLILAQLLADNKPGNLTDKQIEYARTIHSAGSDLLTLINDILDLSKVEAGKMEIHFEEVSLTDLVETIELKFRHVAEDKGLDFHIILADNLPAILYSDGQRLKQILNNLLSNAFKFTNQGEIKLTLQRSSDHDALSKMGLEPDQTIAITVADTGIGIPPEKQKSIFNAFQQAETSTSRDYGGTGLGLSISLQLAKLLGGEIQLLSEENKGSVFTLYLPKINKNNLNMEIYPTETNLPIPLDDDNPTPSPLADATPDRKSVV